VNPINDAIREGRPLDHSRHLAEAAAQAPSDASRIELWAVWFGRVGTVLCALLIVAIAATTVGLFTVERGGGLLFGMFLAFFIPAASIPVGLFCLVGAIVSAKALRRHSSPAVRSAFLLSCASPVAVLACYGACFGILMIALG
jgi:hypothetical protein